MNLLGLIFSIFLLLSYGYYALWDKHLASSRLRNAFTSHSQVNRQIVNQFESAFFNDLKGERKKSSTKKNGTQTKKKKQKPIPLNWDCAKLNLWPLIHEDKETHPELYQLAAKTIRTFYEPLSRGEKRFEYRILDLLIAAAKKSQTEGFSLEKLALADPKTQTIYYKMLKGTKTWNLSKNIGYPPLLDYVKAEPSQDKLCLFHAHPDLLSVLFNPKISSKLYHEIHKKGAPPLTQDMVERIALEMHMVRIDPELLDLLEMSDYPKHEEKQKVFIASDGDVLLRKNLYLKQ